MSLETNDIENLDQYSELHHLKRILLKFDERIERLEDHHE